MTAERADRDWTVAPAATLEEWLEENGLSVRAAVAGSTVRNKAAAQIVLEEALGRHPLTPDHCGTLAKVTGISERMWANLEAGYRADLAAGRTDCEATGG